MLSSSPANGGRPLKHEGRLTGPYPAQIKTTTKFLGEESGTVTIFAVLGFAMILVIVGLIVDVGRVMNVHSQANSYADRVALAAAAELDQRGSALTRAINAAQGANAQVETGFRLTLSGDDSVGVRKLTFLSTLGPDPTDPFTPSPVPGDVVTATWTPAGGLVYEAGVTATEANRDTTFVLVDTTVETENYLFFPLLAAIVPGMETGASVAPQAVAGFRRTLCNYPPIFVCNPGETAGAGAPLDPVPGQMIFAKEGQGGSWGPGNFGLLDAPGIGNGTGGAAAIREYMARRDPNTRCTSDTVTTKPGASTGPVGQGMNVRMDMYNGPMNGNKNNAQYTPAPNVLKGLTTTGGSCKTDKSPSGANQTTPLPRDNCFMPTAAWPDGAGAAGRTGCTFYDGSPRYGDGNWARNEYWATNHPGVPQPAGYATMTRYDVYRYEIEAPNLVNKSPPGENAAPSCSSSPTTADPGADRRVLPVAVVNCRAAGISGSTDIQADVVGYMDVFLTEPVGNTNWWGATNQDLYVEVIDFVGADTATSVLREYPVLYR